MNQIDLRFWTNTYYRPWIKPNQRSRFSLKK